MPNTNVAPVSIAIFDDDADEIRRLTSFFGEKSNVQVISTAPNGLTAIEIISNNHLDAIIVDMLMPQKDGFCVLDELNSLRPATEKPVVIATTSIPKDSYAKSIMAAGADHILLKPFDLESAYKRIISLTSAKNMCKSDETVQSYSNNSAVSIENYLARTLQQLGVSSNLVGYKYLTEAVLYSIENMDAVESITKSLYPHVAIKFETSPSRVERALRHVISSTWQKGGEVMFNKLTGRGNALLKRPTNSEFVSSIRDYILMTK